MKKAIVGAMMAVAMTAAACSVVCAEDGGSKKIAVMRNMTSSDHTTQFFAGCVAEGEALGYTVETFMADGDDVKMQNIMEQNLNQDYDIWILSHANEGYQYDIVSKAVEKGIKVVGFDCGGDHVEGVTYTSQSDGDLTEISLDAMIEKAEEMGKTQPIKMIEVNTLGAIVPFDTRHAKIEEYEKEGKIEVGRMISPNLAGGDAYAEVNTGVSTAIQSGLEFDGVWSASTGFLDGVMDAVNASGNEYVVTGIDISDTELQRLASEPMYYCCAAVDPYVIGMVDVRIAVSKVLGLETPETFQFPAVGIKNTDVEEGATMASLKGVIDGFGESDEFLSDELKALYK